MGTGTLGTTVSGTLVFFGIGPPDSFLGTTRLSTLSIPGAYERTQQVRGCYNPAWAPVPFPVYERTQQVQG